MSERASVPMSPPPPPRSAQATHAGESTADRALRIALATREQVGAPPDPVRDAPATGLVKLVLDLGAKVEHLDTSVAKLTDAIDADRRAREAEAAAAKQRREPWSWAARLAIGTAIAIGVGGALTALGAYLARHWH